MTGGSDLVTAAPGTISGAHRKFWLATFLSLPILTVNDNYISYNLISECTKFHLPSVTSE